MAMRKLTMAVAVVMVAGLAARATLGVFFGSATARVTPCHAASPSETARTHRQAGISAHAMFPRSHPERLDCFPGRLGDEELYKWLPPADRDLADASSAPPPLFTRSFVGLCKSAIARTWLPDDIPVAMYLAKGEGAYRARTAYLCKMYEREGTRVILKGLVGSLVVIMWPLPAELGPESEAALGEAASLPPKPWVYPYKDSVGGPPGAIVSLFASVCDSVLTRAAHPVNEDCWRRRTRLVAMGHGGLYLSYNARGPVEDPGLGGGRSADAGVYLWTNGRLLVAEVCSTPDGPVGRTELFEVLQPTLAVSTQREATGDVVRVTTRNEWTDGEGHLLQTRQQATHQYFYLHGIGESRGTYKARIRLGRESEELGVAEWLSVASDAVHTIASYRYSSGQIAYHIADAESRTKALAWLKERRDRCNRALEILGEQPCPTALAQTREEVLSAVEGAAPLWALAWPRWQSALEKPDGVTTDYDDVVAAVEQEIADRDLLHPDLWVVHDAIKQAKERLGVWVDEWW